MFGLWLKWLPNQPRHLNSFARLVTATMSGRFDFGAPVLHRSVLIGAVGAARAWLCVTPCFDVGRLGARPLEFARLHPRLWPLTAQLHRITARGGCFQAAGSLG